MHMCMCIYIYIYIYIYTCTYMHYMPKYIKSYSYRALCMPWWRAVSSSPPLSMHIAPTPPSRLYMLRSCSSFISRTTLVRSPSPMTVVAPGARYFDMTNSTLSMVSTVLVTRAGLWLGVLVHPRIKATFSCPRIVGRPGRSNLATTAASVYSKSWQ